MEVRRSRTAEARVVKAAEEDPDDVVYRDADRASEQLSDGGGLDAHGVCVGIF